MSRIGRLLDEALEDLHRVDAVLADRLAAIREASSAWPGTGGSSTTRGGRCADPTAVAASRADRARQDHELVERKVRAVRRQADELVALMARYALRAPTAAERRETLSALERNEAADECWSCARVTGEGGSPLFSPAARRVTLADGEARLLCWWCLDWLRKGDGSVPTVGQVDQHRRGIPVRRPKTAS